MASQSQQQMKFEPTWESLQQYQVPDWRKRITAAMGEMLGEPS